MPSLWELSQQEQGGTGDPVLDRAMQINESTSRVYDRIRGNAELSADGKRRQIAKAYVETQRQLAEHKAATDQARADRVTSLTRSAFGTPSDPIAQMSYRQAQQIAEGITDPQTAQVKLTAAMREGDTLLAQAIARHAADHAIAIPGLPAHPAWASVVNDYTAAHPRVGDALNELSAMNQGLQQQFMQTAYFSHPKPSELDRLGDEQIESLAAENPGG